MMNVARSVSRRAAKRAAAARPGARRAPAAVLSSAAAGRKKKVVPPHEAELGDDIKTSRYPGTPGAPFTNKLSVALSDHKIPIYRVMDLAGKIEAKDYPEDRYSQEFLVKIYETMIKLNALDTVFYDAQRQGRISFYMTSNGEEASTVASAAALDQNDMIYGQYRESGAFLWRGYTLENIADQCFSNEHDLGKGRQMPVHYGSRKLHLQTISSPLSTQIPQAAGSAYAFKRAKIPNVVVCYFGEGAASEGDFHAALNAASTLECPVIFYCRNNGYAISTPVNEQYRGDGIASRAVGYGMHVARVDGNDALAVLDTMTEARKVALEQNRPVLVEAMSYRGGHHSTSDDSTRYREPEEIKYWNEENSSMVRFRRYLESRGWWDADREASLRQEMRKSVLKQLARAEGEKKPSIDELFTDVYDEMPQNLRDQQRELLEHLDEFGDKYGLSIYAEGEAKK